MRKELYEECRCQGGLITMLGTCRCCEGRGFVKIGLSLGQVERMVDAERAIQGDPGIPYARRVIILRGLKDKLNKAWEAIKKEK